MVTQLSLALSLRSDATFANFLATDGVRQQAVALYQVGQDGGPHLVYLWGARGGGLNHFAQAACNSCASVGENVQYLPLVELLEMDAEGMLEGLEEMDVVCLHGVDSIAGHHSWERGVFNLYNRVVGRGHRLLVTGKAPPSQLGVLLPDLVSRLCSGLTYHFAPYSDDDKLAILRFRAARLGLELSDDVASFILSRCPRDTGELMAALHHLDSASLEAKRRLTIPFVKSIFGW